MRHLYVWRDHLKEHQPKAVDVVFASLLLVLEQDALVDFRLFWIKERDLPYSKIANFDVTVVWIDVNGFASQLAVDQLILVEEFEALEDLVAPVLDHDESGQSYLLDVLSDGSCCDQLGDQDELRTNCRYSSLFIRPQSKIVILCLALITLIWWNTLINFTVLTSREYHGVRAVHQFDMVMAAHQNILMSHVSDVVQDLRHLLDFLLWQLLEQIDAPSYLTARVIVVAPVDGAILTLGDKFARLDIPTV